MIRKGYEIWDPAESDKAISGIRMILKWFSKC